MRRCPVAVRTVPALISFLLLTAQPSQTSASSESCDCVTPTAAHALLYRPGARELSLGGAGVAGAHGPTASYYNPALLSWQDQSKTGMLGTTYFAIPQQYGVKDLHYMYLPVTFSVDKWGQFSLSITHVTRKKTNVDELGNVFGTFETLTTAIALSYSSKFTEKISAGITAKWFYDHPDMHGVGYERSDPHGTGLAFDIGMAYRYSPSLMFGVALRNYGPHVQYVDAIRAIPMPVNFNIGAAWMIIDTPSHVLTFVGDVYKPLVQDYSRSWYLAPIRGWFDEDVYKVDRIVNDRGELDTIKHRSTFRTEMRQVDVHIGAEYSWRERAFLRLGWFKDWDRSQAETSQGFRYGAGIRTTLWRVRVEADVARIESTGDSKNLGDRTAFSLALAI